MNIAKLLYLKTKHMYVQIFYVILFFLYYMLIFSSEIEAIKFPTFV